MTGGSTMATEAIAVASELAPSGRLRAAINLGNGVLAQRAADGTLRGVSVELSKEVARRLGLPLEPVVFDAAGKVFAALQDDAWDIAFMALDPVRARQVDFTQPYVLIEATYLVAADSPYRQVAELDAPGRRIGVSRGAAYDLVLQRELRHAQLVHAASPGQAYELFGAQRLDALAGVRQPLATYAQDPRWRVLDDSIVKIEQAIATPKARRAAHAWLQVFIGEMKSSGFVARALADSGQGDAVVAA
jgi:polar amino acid transport system substrate-binding protein